MKRLFISLAVAMMLVAVMATPAMAATDSGTTDVTGNVVATIDVTAPATHPLGDFVVGTNPYENAFNVEVDCNVDGWTLTVADTKTVANDGGKMTVGANVLANDMQIKGGDLGTYTDVPASDEAALSLKDGTGEVKGEDQMVDVDLEQVVTYADPVASGYSIVLTFTGATP